MTHLLMLDFDTRLLSAVSRALRENGVDVTGVQSLELARKKAATESFDAALLDGDLVALAELDEFGSLPLILTKAFLEPSDGNGWLSQRRILRKPFTTAELLSVLHDTIGPLHSPPRSLVDVLRRAHTEGQSLALRAGRGEVFVQNGEVVHAEFGGAVGEAALADVLAEVEPVVVRIPERAVGRTIDKPFQPLLLDLLRFIEERERRGSDAYASESPLRLVRGGLRS